MKGDFTRDTFDASKQFTRVLMQQGRVQLDADWNEQNSILLHYLQTLAADVIGPHGGPIDNLGFGISVGTDSPAGDFLIGAGVYYVGGIRCENETQSTYFRQEDYPLIASDKLNEQGSPYLVYLDVWERHVTHNEDPDIREVALGGPDTASRVQIVRQVKTMKSDDPDFTKITIGQVRAHPPDEQRALLEIINKDHPDFNKRLAALNGARLKARAFVAQPSTDPCAISPDARYRGAENQLYRVEIHRSGGVWDGKAAPAATMATFKWSRENGSVVFPIRRLQGNVATLAHLGRDDRFGLREGDLVEAIDNLYVFRNSTERLLVVQSIDRDRLQVTFDQPPAEGLGEAGGALLRRWDHNGRVLKLDAGAALILEGTGNNDWLTLEDGVQIQFQPPDAGGEPIEYHAGDYWLIPARTATGDVEWPRLANDPKSLPPRGIKHHYAPLHRISVAAGAKVTANAADDLRRHFDGQAKAVRP